MGAIDTSTLDAINEQLEGLIDSIDYRMNKIEAIIKNADKSAQKEIDKVIEEISAQITIKLNDIREKVINFMKPQVQTITEKVQPLMPLWKILQGEITLDPLNLIQPIIDICKVLTAPYQPFLDLATEVAPKLIQLSNNMQKVANYKPTIEVPEGVNIPSLNINIEPITPSDIGL